MCARVGPDLSSSLELWMRNVTQVATASMRMRIETRDLISITRLKYNPA